MGTNAGSRKFDKIKGVGEMMNLPRARDIKRQFAAIGSRSVVIEICGRRSIRRQRSPPILALVSEQVTRIPAFSGTSTIFSG